MRKILLLTLSIVFISCQQKVESPAKKAMVVSAHSLASDIGLNILKKGGNAFDAAIAVNYALAIAYPRAGNIAGGGFMLYRTAAGDLGSLDFREMAPKASYRDMYLDSSGNLIEDASTLGATAVAVPGAVAGMEAIYQRFASMEMSELLKESIELAQKGFAINKAQADKWDQYRELFIKVNSESIPYVKDELWEEADTFKLPELAYTLELIVEQGAKGFYHGEIAEKIIESLGANSMMTLEDLKDYEVKWRDVISSDYKEYQIHCMAPPSSGGVALVQLFRAASSYDFDAIPFNSANYIHLLTEMERRVYADRATHLGDPEFCELPLHQLLDEAYIDSRMSDINMGYKTKSEKVKAGTVDLIESHETTHFSIVDEMGNAVSITTTLNGNFGSKLYVQGGGFLLNNEMDDFSSKPGVANQFGLVGAEANAIAPDKRMLSSMSPTIIEKNGDLFLVLGSPGGSSIITSVFQTAMNMLEFEMNIVDAVNAPKTHSQWLPDKIYYESGIDSLLINQLEAKGHILHDWEQIGKMSAISVRDGQLNGAADENRSFGTVAAY